MTPAPPGRNRRPGWSLSGRSRPRGRPVRRAEGGRQMTMIVSARRRQADDLQRLLPSGRASTPAGGPGPGAAGRPGPQPGAGPARTVGRLPRPRCARSWSPRRPRGSPAPAVPAPAGPTQRSHPGPAGGRCRRRRLGRPGVGAAAASTQALPGDSLYGLKRQIENVQLDLARGDLAHGRELLQQADARLSEAEAPRRLRARLGPRHPRPGDRTALDDMDAAVVLGVGRAERRLRETGDDEPLLVLDRFVTEQRERLDRPDAAARPVAAGPCGGHRRATRRLDQQISALLGAAGRLRPRVRGRRPDRVRRRLGRRPAGRPGRGDGDRHRCGARRRRASAPTATGPAAAPASGTSSTRSATRQAPRAAAARQRRRRGTGTGPIGRRRR